MRFNMVRMNGRVTAWVCMQPNSALQHRGGAQFWFRGLEQLEDAMLRENTIVHCGTAVLTEGQETVTHGHCGDGPL